MALTADDVESVDKNSVASFAADSITVTQSVTAQAQHRHSTGTALETKVRIQSSWDNIVTIRHVIMLTSYVHSQSHVCMCTNYSYAVLTTASYAPYTIVTSGGNQRRSANFVNFLHQTGNRYTSLIDDFIHTQYLSGGKGIIDLYILI